MIFKEENGRCFAELANGDVVEFESADEMRAAEREYNEIQELFGRPLSAAKGGTSPVVRGYEKKKVRIFIDPDVEYLGNKKALARRVGDRCESLGLVREITN